eukprot:CAMPEP_0195031494 /NCGR_PEP_ID=MMETSP0326_2-20130528/61342_1 /TAXON_ID=2866 ORGANISM="Crypthecodinium cohnii, Strain Seligo" /NCGR_SAMPLE_ID=MMETSP0326_2 /ASSEMBLY_ACC=CAM_ASM_000348 /LENGTH=65 /DNA_ID=CAMNT_0040055231 /DNA_START=35 /DNA_END=232 /DNA_ORIENTATION=+
MRTTDVRGISGGLWASTQGIGTPRVSTKALHQPKPVSKRTTESQTLNHQSQVSMHNSRRAAGEVF